MNAKKPGPSATVRFDVRLMALIDELIAEHNAGTISAYIRGLIVADALKMGKPLAGIDIPGWQTSTLLENIGLEKDKAHAQEASQEEERNAAPKPGNHRRRT